jgi:anti-sigma B factor antagonist
MTDNPPPELEEFELEDETLGEGRRCLSVHGVIDLFTAPELKARLVALIEGGATEVIVDLSDATYMDSTGLGAMLAAARRLGNRGGRLAIAGPRPAISRVFEIAGLDTLLTVVGTRAEALLALDRLAAAEAPS